MYCKKCGVEIQVDSKFCSKCGAKCFFDNKNTDAEYASFGKRAIAYLVDVLILYAFYFVGGIIGGALEISTESDSTSGAISGLLFFVWIVLVSVMETQGGSPGKRWLKLKVIDRNNEPISFPRSFFRSIFKIILYGLWVISWIVMETRKDSKMLHDLFVNTRVVLKNEEK